MTVSSKKDINSFGWARWCSQQLRLLLLLVLALVLVACSATKGKVPEQASLSGTVTYRERIALPPGALVNVQLQDQSLQDVKATVLAETTVEAKSGPPYAFSLDYFPPQIVPRRTYGLSVRITVGDQLWFINDTHIPAFPEDGSEHDIVVRRVGSSGR
jgi:putative lipoprotein